MATMFLQTLGATNVRVMLPLRVQELGGGDSFFGYLQAVRYFAICLSLIVAPALFELARSCLSRPDTPSQQPHERDGGGGVIYKHSKDGVGSDTSSTVIAEILPLGLLLPAIASLNVLVALSTLDNLGIVVAVLEATNCVVYVSVI